MIDLHMHTVYSDGDKTVEEILKQCEEKHLEYIKYLRELGRKIPPFMETASEALQLLYDTNIICYKIYETLPNGKRKNKMFWSYKERNYANMQPEVKKGGEYSFHMAYARAFRWF